jgi:hypothetical protein
MFPLPTLDVTALVVFTLGPTLVPFTLTEKVHEAPAASVAPESPTEPLPAVAVMAPPPHEPARPFGVETRRPAGKVSVNPIPVSVSGLPAGLLIVKARVLMPFRAIEDGVKALEMMGVLGFATVRVALAPAPVPPLVDETGPVVLVYVPTGVAVTLTVTAQELFTGTLPPVSETVPLPAFATGVPPQLLVSPLGVATKRFTGKLSVKATPADATGFGLVIVIVSVEIPFGTIVVGLKALAMLGGATTVSVAEAVRLSLASLDVTGPAVLLNVPAPPVTEAVTVQIAPPASVPPVSWMLLGETVNVPPHVVAPPLGKRPAGKRSVKDTFVSAEALELVIVKVTVVLVPRAIELLPNALLNVGAGSPAMVIV